MSTGDNRTTRARTIALAGLFQAATLVRQTGLGKVRDEVATRASIGSILKTDATSVEDVYGGIAPLRTGLETLSSQLGRVRHYAAAPGKKTVTGQTIAGTHHQRHPAARDAVAGHRPARPRAHRGTG